MRRRHLAAFVFSFPLAAIAHAGATADPTRVRFRTAEQLEAIELTCAARATADGPVVGCRWSSPSVLPAAGVRLIRFDPAVDPYRTVVLRTADLSVTEYVDRDVRAGHRYGYAVQVVAAGGRLVGRSRAERCWTALPSFEPRRMTLRPWLLRIAANTIASHHRSEARRRRREHLVAVRDERDARDQSDAELFADSGVLDALGRLAERHQQVLTLRYLADLSTAEAAEAMRVGRGHFAVLQYRALGALRHQWEGSRDV